MLLDICNQHFDSIPVICTKCFCLSRLYIQLTKLNCLVFKRNLMVYHHPHLFLFIQPIYRSILSISISFINVKSNTICWLKCSQLLQVVLIHKSYYKIECFQLKEVRKINAQYISFLYLILYIFQYAILQNMLLLNVKMVSILE